jgi:pimeloyl-ACP methyl ester carboxylesterase
MFFAQEPSAEELYVTFYRRSASLKQAAVDQHKAGVAHAQIQIMEKAGHACFWDDPAAFNRRLRALAESLEGFPSA